MRDSNSPPLRCHRSALPDELTARGAEGWFRANLPASSARCFHQISFLGLNFLCLVRTAGIEPASTEWRSEAQPIDHVRKLVGRDGVEPPQTMRGVYSALGSPMPSLPDDLVVVVSEVEAWLPLRHSDKGARLGLTRVSPVHPWSTELADG